VDLRFNFSLWTGVLQFYHVLSLGDHVWWGIIGQNCVLFARMISKAQIVCIALPRDTMIQLGHPVIFRLSSFDRFLIIFALVASTFSLICRRIQGMRRMCSERVRLGRSTICLPHPLYRRSHLLSTFVPKYWPGTSYLCFPRPSGAGATPARRMRAC